MKHISEQNVEKCLEIMDQLCKYKTASIYMHPVEPQRDNCPDYFNIISNPMDFSTVRSKLTSKSYATISEWKKDVNLIFNNSKLYNSKDSLYGITAQYLQKKFNEMIKYFSEDGWLKKLDYLQDQIKNLLQSAPPGLPKPYYSFEEIESKRSQLFSDINISKKVYHHKNNFQGNISTPLNKVSQINSKSDVNKKCSITNVTVIPKKINVSNQSDIKITKLVNQNKVENQAHFSTNSSNINQNTVKKYYLYNQNISNPPSKLNKQNDASNNFNLHSSITDNSVNKSTINKIVSTNSANSNIINSSSKEDNHNERNYIQMINYTNLYQDQHKSIINNNNINKKINNRKESNNSNYMLDGNVNNITNNYATSQNSINDMNSYNINYRNRNNRNNDSDSSDGIFVLDD